MMRDLDITVKIKFTHKANAAAHDASLLKLRDEIIASLNREELLEPDTGNGRDPLVYNPAEGGNTDRGVN